MKSKNNWDHHYQKLPRKLLSKLGLKGLLFLNREVEKFITKNSNKFGSFIEIGVGGGLLSKLMSKKFIECFILDKSEIALKVASRRAKKSTPILCDIFMYQEKEKYDAVASLGLVEHFNDVEMERLVFIHLEIANPDGCVFILVPAHSKQRENEVELPRMVEKYGFQDAFAEYKIDDFLKSENVPYKKIYFDKIPCYTWYYKILRKLVLIPYLMFGLNLENFIRREKGNHALFFINKKNLK